MNAIVAPRPIGWVSTLSSTGVRNLAPYSFFNLFNYQPPIIGFASTGWKDSVANITATGEFVWNLVTRPLAAAMNASSASVAGEIDEFDLAGIETLPSQLVAPDRVALSPVQFECCHTQTLRLRTQSGEAIDTWLILGEVVGVHIAPHLIVDGRYDTAAAEPVLRGGGGGDYFTVLPENLFRMRRSG